MHQQAVPKDFLIRAEMFPMSMTFLRQGAPGIMLEDKQLRRFDTPFDLIMTSMMTSALQTAMRIKTILKPTLHIQARSVFFEPVEPTELASFRKSTENAVKLRGLADSQAIKTLSQAAALTTRQTMEEMKSSHVLVIADSPLLQAIGTYFYENDQQLIDLELGIGDAFRIRVSDQVLREPAVPTLLEVCRLQ